MNPDFRPAIRRALTAACAPKFLLREIVRRPEPRVDQNRVCGFMVRGTNRHGEKWEHTCRAPARGHGFCLKHAPEKLRRIAQRNLDQATARLREIEENLARKQTL